MDVDKVLDLQRFAVQLATSSKELVCKVPVLRAVIEPWVRIQVEAHQGSPSFGIYHALRPKAVFRANWEGLSWEGREIFVSEGRLFDETAADFALPLHGNTLWWVAG